jgi:hypothetical protein
LILNRQVFTSEQLQPASIIMHKSTIRSAIAWLTFLATANACFALTILSGPTFARAVNAPLAGTLQLTTDAPSRVEITVSDGTAVWTRSFYDYSTSHSVPLFGFKANRTNQITVTVRDRFRNEYTTVSPATFISAPLPATLPPITALVSQPEKMEPGYTLFRVVNNNGTIPFLVIVDNQGEVVWYSSTIQTVLDVRQLPDGNLLIPLTTNFTEVNLLGQTVKSWGVPNNLQINMHDGVPTSHNSFLYITDDSRTVSGFPTSSTDPNAPTQTTKLLFNRIIEVSATNGAVLGNWSLIDMLDPLRISYLTFTFANALGWDCEHANAVIEDPRDDSIIVSMRTQNAVIKFSRSTGQLKWILGPHENWGPSFQPYLLTAVGTPFEWNYGQHAPMITPQGTLLIYDDGNFRASPFDASVPDATNYSRAVEYEINEDTMEVSQVWEYGGNVAEPIFTSRVGNADWLPKTGNVLVTFGNVDYLNHVHPAATAPAATMLRIKEVTHDENAEVVFDLSVFDYTNLTASYRGDFAYRSRRMPDLYGHPAMPVEDLKLTLDGGLAHLDFSGDPTRTYIIESSDDLVHWDAIGIAAAENDGNFTFDDMVSESSDSRYYRVETQ